MENELKKMANFNKKRKQGRGWWVNLDAGDVPKANTFFNSVSGETSISEDVERLPNDFKPKKIGKGYKVFRLMSGKLYPPMVANNGGEATPMHVWLKAQVAQQAPPSKEGRPQVQGGGKGTGHSKLSLAFRPGWHLGDIPYATQFMKKDGTWPKDLVWAECDFAMDIDYQEEANAEGYTAKGGFKHAYAGLKKVPENGYYRYRTNPNPDTVPWIITGAMRVNRVLDDDEVEQILAKNGIVAPKVVGGNRKNIMQESLGKGKDEIFALIKEINPNAKEENYRDKDVNQMLSILFDMRKRRRNYDKDRFEEKPFTGVERDLEDGQLYHYNNDIKGEVATEEEESEPEYWREGKTMNIREELNRLDWEHIDEGFDLRNLYCAREWSKDDKKKIATMICNGNITKLHDFLNESLNESVSNGTDILLKEVKLALSKLNIPYESICTEGMIYRDYEANVVVSNHEREYSKDEIEAVKDECEHCGDASYGLTCGYWENKYSMLFYTLANSKNVREGYDDFKSYPEFQEEYHKLKDGRQGYFVVRDNNNKEFVRTTYEPEAKEVQERHPGSWIDFVEVDKDNVDEALYINQPDRKIWKTVRGAIKATKDDDIDYQADNVMDNLYNISDRKSKKESLVNKSNQDKLHLDEDLDESSYDSQALMLDDIPDWTEERWVIADWLAEHEQALADALAYLNVEDIYAIDKDKLEELKAWICEHGQLADDFKSHFGVSLCDKHLKEEKENDVLRKGLFEVVDMNPDEPFVGYTKDEHWQIWDVPYFEKETVLELNKKYVKSGDEFDLLYDAKRDGFIEIVYGKGLHFFKGFVAETEDGKKKLYGIGAWEWLWSEVEPKEDEDGTYYATIR